jgi:hypothetical protein
VLLLTFCSASIYADPHIHRVMIRSRLPKAPNASCPPDDQARRRVHLNISRHPSCSGIGTMHCIALHTTVPQAFRRRDIRR